MPAKPAVPLIEMHDDVPEVIVETDIRKIASDEAFMHEIVTVLVHPSANENDPQHFVLNVNNTNQPVFRGAPTPIRRKYLEVLARMKETKYTQPQRDMANPELGNQVIGRTALVYPFEVLEDKNPRGAEWLRGILAEPA